MAQTSTNLGLTLPEETDNVNVSVISNDFSLIDAQFGGIAGTLPETLSALQTGKAPLVHTHATDEWFTTALSNKSNTGHSHSTDSWFTTALSEKATTQDWTGQNAILVSNSGWNDTSGSAPYTKSVTVTGLKTTDIPFMDFYPDSTGGTVSAGLEAYQCISYAEVTAANTLTLTCLEDEPAVSFKIQLKVVR